MQAFFSSEGSYALQFLVIFLAILVLFLIAALLFMRLSGRGLTLSANASQRGRQPRLGIVDIYELDRQRQLILLRRDNVEHLLLVGGPNDVVIERHIQRGAGSRYAPDGSARPGGEAGLSDPALEPRTDPFLDSPMPPTFAMPEVVPSAVSGAQAALDRAPPLDPGLFEPEALPADAPARPVSPVSRLMRRTAPPVVSPRPEVASQRPARPESAAAEPVPEPPVIASRGPRSVDPAVLSDMARQLQVALKRPSSAVTPPPADPAEVPPPARKPAEPAPAPIDPVAAAMAAEPAPPMPAPPPPVRLEPAPAPVVAAPRPEPKPAAPAKPVAPPPFVAPPKPDAVKSEPFKAEPPKPEPSKPEPLKAEPPEPAAQAQNPFSVEEIEAEFARLLGRPLDSKN
ncbi:hypothetical protein [Methylorubrum extorquens]|uniref:hypothetical protein n=1 Tax=Methylorubrum extorquens TaxID=408 RepID=UPI001EE5755F|nr:hypothetical protein [Methylorubrum extorquens]MCG5245153.1 hypothetical protein [Methylorubrum extorquens]